MKEEEAKILIIFNVKNEYKNIKVFGIHKPLS